MDTLWRHPLLPIGILLCILGLGNTWVSAGKVGQYGRRLKATTSLESSFDRAEIHHLTARTNESLLKRLHRGPGPSSAAAAKRDFYTLVYNGGRLIALVGFLLALLGARGLFLDAQSWPSRRRA
jgi:hypothetical protein